MARKGRSAAALKKLRKKFRLGEFSARKRRSARKPERVRRTKRRRTPSDPFAYYWDLREGAQK